MTKIGNLESVYIPVWGGGSQVPVGLGKCVIADILILDAAKMKSYDKD